MAEKSKFPEGFYWGSATSAYQVEGGIENNDWAQPTLAWPNLSRQALARAKSLPLAGRACDHYNRYESDFDIARNLGQNAHRFSIEWARIEPEEGKFDEGAIEHYRKVLQALHERGLEPFVTLWHFTLPIWFAHMGGFENKKAPFYFARYCEYVVSRLAASASSYAEASADKEATASQGGIGAKFWITINEPFVYAWAGYMKRYWPPFKFNPFAFWKVIKTLISSHLTSYNIIKKINPNLKVGIAKNNFDFDSTKFNLLGRTIQPIRKLFWNHYFLKKISRQQDFIGLNFYFHKHFGYKFYEQKSDMGWPIYPRAIHHVLMELKKYQKPIYITENGIADAADTKRAKFIKDHLYWVHRAIHDGADVRGYFYWSLLDNFEWAHGFSKRFGLVEIDYGTLERKIRPSAYEYKKICQTNSLETSN
jgi:beta-glucosidase